MLKLTQYETGDPLYVRPESIKAIVPIRAEVYEGFGGPPQEEGNRTRIHLDGQMIELVTETADEIYKMIQDTTP